MRRLLPLLAIVLLILLSVVAKAAPPGDTPPQTNSPYGGNTTYQDQQLLQVTTSDGTQLQCWANIYIEAGNKNTGLGAVPVNSACGQALQAAGWQTANGQVLLHNGCAAYNGVSAACSYVQTYPAQPAPSDYLRHTADPTDIGGGYIDITLWASSSGTGGGTAGNGGTNTGTASNGGTSAPSDNTPPASAPQPDRVWDTYSYSQYACTTDTTPIRLGVTTSRSITSVSYAPASSDWYAAASVPGLDIAPPAWEAAYATYTGTASGTAQDTTTWLRGGRIGYCTTKYTYEHRLPGGRPPEQVSLVATENLGVTAWQRAPGAYETTETGQAYPWSQTVSGTLYRVLAIDAQVPAQATAGRQVAFTAHMPASLLAALHKPSQNSDTALEAIQWTAADAQISYCDNSTENCSLSGSWHSVGTIGLQPVANGEWATNFTPLQAGQYRVRISAHASPLTRTYWVSVEDTYCEMGWSDATGYTGYYTVGPVWSGGVSTFCRSYSLDNGWRTWLIGTYTQTRELPKVATVLDGTVYEDFTMTVQPVPPRVLKTPVGGN